MQTDRMVVISGEEFVNLKDSCWASAPAMPQAEAPEVAMSRSAFEECLANVARRVASEAGRSFSAFKETAAADLERALAQRGDVMDRLETCTDRLNEAQKDLAQHGLALARAQPAADAHTKLLPQYRRLVQERVAQATAAAGPVGGWHPGRCDLCGTESGGDADLHGHVACESCWGRLDLLRGKPSEKQEAEEGDDGCGELDAFRTVCHGVVDAEDEEEASLECRKLCGALAHGGCAGLVSGPGWLCLSCM